MKKNLDQKNDSNKTKKTFSVLFFISLIIFLISITAIFISFYQNKKEEDAFEKLVSIVEESETIIEEDDKQDTESLFTKYLVLKEKNDDFVGWLHIDNTNIDYPVMDSKDNSEYYLHRSFDKTYSFSGTPFISGDIDSDLFIIYGHNMKNDTMFGTLDNYADLEFYLDNPIFSFTTTAESREYEVFAAVKTHILNQDEKGYRWYYQAGDLSNDEFDELIKFLINNSLYDTNIVPTYEEQIVILSTCSYHEENGRFLIAARKVQD